MSFPADIPPPASLDALAPVAVIGAGLSGLTAAYRLHQAGWPVVLLEAGDQPGGVIQSEVLQGFQVEAGPNTFPSSAQELMALCRELKVTPQPTSDLAKKRYLFLKNRLVALPSNPLGLIGSPVLSPGAKLRLLREPFIPTASPNYWDVETVAQSIRRRLGPEVLDNLVGPFLSGIYAGNPETLSMAATFPRLAGWEREGGSLIRGAFQAMRGKKQAQKTSPPTPKVPYQLMSFEAGMATLPRTLAASLPPEAIRYGAKVAHLQPNEAGGVTIQLASGETIQASACILASPAGSAAQALRGWLDPAAELLAEIPYAPLSVVHVGLSKREISHPLDGFGCLLPRKAGHKLLGIIWASSLFPQRAPEGQALLSCFIGGDCHPEVRDWDESQVVQTVLSDLQAVFNQPTRPKTRFIKVYRYAQAIPQYRPGHLTRMTQLERSLADFPALVLAGNYRSGVALNDCVKQGTAAAQAVCRYLNGSVRPIGLPSSIS